MTRLSDQLNVFSTCPQSKDESSDRYIRRATEVARWSEQAGCRGILVYTDNGLVDPWLVSQVILEHTSTICPLVAVQPIYMHPYAAAKMVASFAFLHGRRVFLNMLAGGFKNDLLALNDVTPHDDRYVRTTEYTQILQQLLTQPDPVTFTGKYYSVKNLKMTPPLDPSLSPGILISGSSDAGMDAAKAIGATAIKYPKPPEEEAVVDASSVDAGVRVGIIARADGHEAWRVALERFPEDRAGRITHELAMQVSDSRWHKQLGAMTAPAQPDGKPYWLGPFQHYKTFCPYLVGSYGRVAEQVGRYIAMGYKTFVLDIPPSREELDHTAVVFEQALDLARSAA